MTEIRASRRNSVRDVQLTSVLKDEKDPGRLTLRRRAFQGPCTTLVKVPGWKPFALFEELKGELKFGEQGGDWETQ